jgi:hypothetical protein|tara:strand:+ start:423 stop:1592 length:1170 start_codon:yes stop_codon:yes gene_type:complete
MRPKILIALISTFLSCLIFYFLFFLSVHFEDYGKNPDLFTSINKLNFHKNYSKKLHHLRDVNGVREINSFSGTKSKPEDYLFTTINPFLDGKKNILIQGDSNIERLVSKGSYNLFNDFSKKNNFGLVVSGITSYSPSLMKLQYEILKKDFNIKPNIVVAYIDQTDIGDELCRYEDKRIYDEKNNLVAVKNETYSRAIFDYTKIYNISESVLSDNSQLIKTFKVANFYIKYMFLRALQKYKTIEKYGWKDRDISKCWLRDIIKYLWSSDDSEISFFEDRVKEYLNLLLSDQKIQKIIVVTHPHIGHVYGYKTKENEKKYFTINVSDIIEKIVKNEKKIYHLNFSKLISDGEINLENSPFVGSSSSNIWDSHQIADYQTNVFGHKIINLLK